MRQQEANQFDKGLNLDTNPIAMDNHQLTGALNATMITMNGNELVLQNDMGNGRVDQAQLPEGYVPVGMQEYGGIVYVASYNPIKGESQIGCFPSPQRNFPSTENGIGSTNLPTIFNFVSGGYIDTLSRKELLIGGSDIIRTGDKFVITAVEDNIVHYETWEDYIKLRVIVVNDDGSSFDITDDLTQVRTSSTAVPFLKALTSLNDPSSITNNDFSIYKNKISGKIYLEASLIVPSYINTQIQASKNISTGEVTITITPSSYDLPNGESEVVWSKNSHSYTLNYKINEDGPIQQGALTNGKFIINNLTENDTLWYELYPTYDYSGTVGKVKSLKRENTIAIGDIGTGEVEFSTFRYYNNMSNETFSFDYGLNAYIEGFDGNNHTLNSVYIEAYDIDDLLNNDGSANSYSSLSSNKKIIQLGTSNYFGVYTKMISYGTDTLEVGKHYIARLCAIVNNGQPQTGKWYSIITSTVTNKLYVQSSANMIKIQTDEDNFSRHVFEFDWEAEINRELIDENSSEQVTSDSATSSVLTTAPSNIDQRISYQTKKVGDVTYRHTGTTKIPQSRDLNDFAGGKVKFPYNMSIDSSIQYLDFVANAEIIKNGELADTTVSGFTNEEITTTQTPGDINKVWYTLTGDDLKFNYNLWSQFFQKLLKNPSSGGNTVDDYKFTIDTQMAAFVPYLPAFRVDNYSDNQLTSILGTLAVADVETNPAAGCSPIYTDVQQQYWMYYALERTEHRDSDSYKYSNKHISIIHDTYSHSEYGETVIFDEDYTKKDDYPKWSQLSPMISDAMRNICGFAPAILIWGGCDDFKCALFPTSGPANGDTNNRQAWYGIVMMLDETGNYHVLNQYGKNLQGGLLMDIIKSFANIYVCQPDQQVEFDYWTGDTENYIYTKNYQLNVTYKAAITINENTIPVISNTKYNAYNNLEIRTVDNQQVDDSILTFDDVSIQLPKIKLAAGTIEEQYTDSFSSPDQSVKNSQFLSNTGTPTFDTCAIILDKAGRHIVMNAYRHHTSEEYTPVSFNPNHVYIKSINSFDYETGLSTKLYDIQDTQNILPQVWVSPERWTTGSGWVAQAIRDGKIKVVNNPENNNKILVVVPSRCTKLKNSEEGWWLGESFYNSGTNSRSARRKLSDLCGGFLDIELITGSTHDGSDNRIRKLASDWDVNVYNSNLQPSLVNNYA